MSIKFDIHKLIISRESAEHKKAGQLKKNRIFANIEPLTDYLINESVPEWPARNRFSDS